MTGRELRSHVVRGKDFDNGFSDSSSLDDDSSGDEMPLAKTHTGQEFSRNSLRWEIETSEERKGSEKGRGKARTRDPIKFYLYERKSLPFSFSYTTASLRFCERERERERAVQAVCLPVWRGSRVIRLELSFPLWEWWSLPEDRNWGQQRREMVNERGKSVESAKRQEGNHISSPFLRTLTSPLPVYLSRSVLCICKLDSHEWDFIKEKRRERRWTLPPTG